MSSNCGSGLVDTQIVDGPGRAKIQQGISLAAGESTPGPGSDAPLESRGLAGNLVERSLEIVRQDPDAQVMANLRAELDELMKRPDADILTRENALALLRTLKEALSSAFHKPVGKAGPDQTIVVDGPSMALLEELIDALSDLDRVGPTVLLRRHLLAAPRPSQKSSASATGS